MDGTEIHRVISESDDIPMGDNALTNHNHPNHPGFRDSLVPGATVPVQEVTNGNGPVQSSMRSSDAVGDVGGATLVEPDASAGAGAGGRSAISLQMEGLVGVPFAIRSRNNEQDISSSSLSEDDGDGGGGGLIIHDYARGMAKDDINNYSTSDFPNAPPIPPRPAQGKTSPDSVSSESMERTGSQNSSRDWGWFEDVHQSMHEGALDQQQRGGGNNSSSGRPKKKRGLVPQVSGGEIQDYGNLENTDAAAMAVTAPNYVLEESLSSQRLWKHTAGQRPPQPAEERAFYEKMWAQNFARSKVQYGMPVEVLTATSPISLNPFFDTNFSSTDIDYATASSGVQPTGPDAASAVAEAALHSRLHMPAHHHHHHPLDPDHDRLTDDGATGAANRRVHHVDGDLIVLVKGDNVFGTTVSKSFARPSLGPIAGVDTVNISIASFRVVERKGGSKYAQFLVIYREGSIRDTVGVWKRYSDFEELARKVTQAHEGCASVIANMSPLAVTEEPETEHLPNAITSWRLLKKRQRWYRCLDAGYLSLKVFLLERFLHDILFESSSPHLLREFVGAETM